MNLIRLAPLIFAAALAWCGSVAAWAQPAFTFSPLAGENTPPGYVDGVGSAARFNQPGSVAVDSVGNIYVADENNVVVRKVTPGGVVTTVAGKFNMRGYVDGAEAQFLSPGGVAVALDGTLLVGDARYVRRIAADGTVSTVAGAPNVFAWEGPVNAVTFGTPQALLVDPAGAIFLADTGNNLIRSILPEGFVRTVAGNWAGAPRVAPGEVAGDSTYFKSPRGLARDAAGNIYVADSGFHLIRKITPQGRVSILAGVVDQSGRSDGSQGNALFFYPTGVACDAAGNVYVADSGNSLIRKIAVDRTVTTFAGVPGLTGADDGPVAAATFNSPVALAFAPNGDLIVSDQRNNSIRRITMAGVVSTIAGRSSVASDDGTGAAARFRYIRNPAVDRNGNLYVLDAQAVRKITPAGVVTTVAGRANFPGSADGPGDTARFQDPAGLAVDAAGNVYVGDSGNFTVRKITPDGVVSTLAGRAGERGLVEGPGPAARFGSVDSLALDDAGNLYVNDRDNTRIRKMDTSGAVSTLAGSGAIGSADGPGLQASFRYLSGPIAYSRSRGLFVVEQTGIRLVSLDGTVSTYHVNGADAPADGPVNQGGYSRILGLSADAFGNLYFVDDNQAVREITAAGEIITIGGRAGQRGFLSGVGTTARFNELSGITVDSTGQLLVTDSGNRTVWRGTPTTALVPPVITNTRAGTDSRLTQKAINGATVTFRAAAAGTRPLTYVWLRDGVKIDGATADTLTLTSVTPASQGAYAVHVSNAAGSDSAEMGKLQVYAPAVTTFAKRHEVNGGAFLWAITQGNGRLVAVGTGGSILSSTDGRNWTRQNSGTTDWLVGVTFGAGRFVVVGDNGHLSTSTDGTVWTAIGNIGTTQRLNNIVYGAGQFVAVGEGGVIITSPDALTWTIRQSKVTTWLRGLAYNAIVGHFAVSGQAGVLLVSPDGVAWSPVQLYIGAGDVEALVPITSYSHFVGIGQNGRVTSAYRFQGYSSPFNPVTYFLWQAGASSSGSDVRLRGLTAAANAIFATGENGTILSAPDNTGPWAKLESGTTANLVGGSFVGNTLYIVGENETILQSNPIYNSRLINISTRGQVAAETPMISGFVIRGTQPKQVLLRAVGPSLGDFGVADTLGAPTLTLFDEAQRPLLTNSGWSTSLDANALASTASRVGAFPLSQPADAAILTTLPPGAYTARVSTSGAGGTALVEAYDADALDSEGSRAINISTRGRVAGASNPLIAGFVVNGTAARRVLIRAVGPTLAGFGVAGTLPKPQLKVFSSSGAPQETGGAWSAETAAAEIRSAASLTGAFALNEGSADAALVTTLAPGAWTVQVTDTGTATGTVLIEVYDLP